MKVSVVKPKRKSSKTKIIMWEPKYAEIGFSNPSVTTTPQVYALTDIGQGDNYNNRNGNLIQSKYLQYELVAKQVAGATPICIKVAFVLDRQCNQIAPTFTDAFDTTFSAPFSAMKKIWSNQQRFEILKEHFVTALALGADGTEATMRGYIDLSKLNSKDQVIRYGGTTAASPTTNGIYLMIVSDTAAVNSCTFTGCIRYVFNEV